MFYALEVLAGLRLGEAAGLRWKHYDPTTRPLGRLTLGARPIRCWGGQRGVAIVGRPTAQMTQKLHPYDLEVLRVAVMEGTPNGCSMLYGAIARAAHDMGAEDVFTFTHLDEIGASLRASGWVEIRKTKGGEWDREDEDRQRELAIDAKPKRMWAVPWGRRAQERLTMKKASAA